MHKFLVLLLCAALVGCATDAQIASMNISKSADMFEVNRRVVFYNGITDSYMLTIEGLCSIKAYSADKQLEVTCKIGPNAYKKHFLGLSDNVSYFVEQCETADVNIYHYKVIFKPEAVIPNVDLKTSKGGTQ